MPNYYNEGELSAEQRARYDWAVAEYRRVQEMNRQRSGAVPPAQRSEISPQSALFARLLDGKQALPFPPPTSHSYPWYDIIETPGKYHVSLERPLALIVGAVSTESEQNTLFLNQCEWKILRMNAGASEFYTFLRRTRAADAMTDELQALLDSALGKQPEFILTYGDWGEFRLSLGRIIRRGRRDNVMNSRFDVKTLDGGNPHIVKVLRTGAEIHAKADATLVSTIMNLAYREDEPAPIEKIMLASESAIPRAGNPEGDDVVEYDCDGWVLEKL